MAILKCPHCEYSKEVSDQYAEKTVKCPSCGQPAKVHDTISILTAFSDKISEFETELSELKSSVTTIPQSANSANINEELVDTLAKIFRENRIAMAEFNDATKRWENVTLRSEQQTLLWTRLGITGFFILLMIIVFLVFNTSRNMQVFSENAHAFSEQMQLVGSRVKTISDDLGNVKQTVGKLNAALSSNDLLKYQEIVSSVGDLHDSMTTVQHKMRELNDNLSQIRQQLKESNAEEQRYRPYR
jgi:DNA repair exonuclease SbcCD ATPase subunit